MRIARMATRDRSRTPPSGSYNMRRPIVVAPAFMDSQSMFRMCFFDVPEHGCHIPVHGALRQCIHAKVTFGHHMEHAPYVLNLVPKDSRVDARKLVKDPSTRVSHWDLGTAPVINFTIANLSAPSIFRMRPAIQQWK